MAGIVIGTELIGVCPGITIEKAMISLGRHPDAFLFFVDGKPVPMTLTIADGMEVSALRVASGG